MLDPQTSVASIVLDHSECAAVFQKHRIDFCCGGKQSVEAASTSKGVSVDALMSELDRAVQSRRGKRSDDPRELSTPALIGHVITTFHEPLRKSLPFLVPLAAKVGRVHGDHNPKLRALATAVDELSVCLLAHLDEEETHLFPLLMANNRSEAAGASLSSMQDEHLAVGQLLERIRAASEDFALPDWACNSYRTLFAELAQIESDIFAHVHLENHVLAPRFTS